MGQSNGQAGAMVGGMVAMALQRALKYGEALAEGISDDIAARKPQGLVNGKATLIDTNHAVFAYGHLSVYPARLWALQGKEPPAGVSAPDGWADLFKAGAACHDDPSRSIYPAWQQVLGQYRRGYEAVQAVLPTLADSVFVAETPDPKVREIFPNIGSLSAFLFVGHLTMHFGQVSAWRRCFGLPSAT